jgi:hypothetical protein
MKAKTIWMGIIPGIFGYGISVASETEAGAMKALRKAYAEWKVARPNQETNFKSSFEQWGGHVFEVELNKSYFDSFNS